MTAPTSPKTPTGPDRRDDTLRTDLTKLADEWMRRAPLIPEAQVRALLAAHPAEVVSDTRREDAALVETAARALFDSDYAGYSAARLDGIWAEMRGGAERADYFVRARAVLAVLPAPPVVDEAALAEHLWPHMDGHDGPSAEEVASLVVAYLRAAPPVVDEAEIEAAAITEARVRFRRQRMNVGTSQDREEQAFREGAVFAACLRGATRG